MPRNNETLQEEMFPLSMSEIAELNAELVRDVIALRDLKSAKQDAVDSYNNRINELNERIRNNAEEIWRYKQRADENDSFTVESGFAVAMNGRSRGGTV